MASRIAPEVKYRRPLRAAERVADILPPTGRPPGLPPVGRLFFDSNPHGVGVACCWQSEHTAAGSSPAGNLAAPRPRKPGRPFAACSTDGIAVRKYWHRAARMAKPGSPSDFALVSQYRVVVRASGSTRRSLTRWGPASVFQTRSSSATNWRRGSPGRRATTYGENRAGPGRR